jgi:chemotaxis protein CheD
VNPGSPGEPYPRYFSEHYQREIVTIKSGEFYATTRLSIIGTVLGSCVAACIRDTVRGGAGMNHFLLPGVAARSGLAWNDEPSLRYGAFAMESLINEFIRRGSRREDLEAKIFGGASLAGFVHSDVGRQNARFVVDYLAAEDIRVTVSDLGGARPRKLLLFVETGRVLVKYLGLDTPESAEAAARDLDAIEHPQAVASSADLF